MTTMGTRGLMPSASAAASTGPRIQISSCAVESSEKARLIRVRSAISVAHVARMAAASGGFEKP